MTSVYIPSIRMVEIINKLAPEFKIKFKTEKSDRNTIIAISPAEFLEGEKIFESIIKGMNPNWNENQKCRYLYNQTGIMLSYDFNILTNVEYSNFHEMYARNIFTAISRNWGICSSFAGTYDYLCYKRNLESTILSEKDHDYVMTTDSKGANYLTDPTRDSARLKFGLKTRYYAISRDEFEKDKSHNLQETEASEYSFSTISEKELEEIDRSIGFLDNFGGEYTDNKLSEIANNLNGQTILEKALDFMEKIKDLKTVGRPTDSDYIIIGRWILSRCQDKEFANKIEISSFAYEEKRELPRRVLFIVTDEEKRKKYFEFDYNAKIINEIDQEKIKKMNFKENPFYSF